jgi:hypothetical protein
MTGKELMESGLLVSIKGRPSQASAPITYRRTKHMSEPSMSVRGWIVLT